MAQRVVDAATGEVIEPDPQHMAVDLMREFDDGETSVYATEKLRELMERCRRLGRKGTLTWTWTVTPAGEELAIGMLVVTKLPEPDAAVHTYFTDEDGNPTRDNPRKRPLPGFERVTGISRRAVRVTPNSTGEDSE